MEQIQENKEEIEKMWALFNEHWDAKMKIDILLGIVYRSCESCNTALFGENKSLYHDHLLEKGNPLYEHLKYEIENLYLCCGDCHTKKGNGFPTENHKKAIDAAKKRYNIE